MEGTINNLLFKAMFESSSEGVLIVNAKGEIILSNQMAQKVFCYSEEELKDEKIEILIPERFQHGHHKYREGYVKNPKVRPMGKGINLSGMRKNGEEFPIEVSLSHSDMDGEMVIIALVTDITERVNIEKSVKESREHLRRLNKELEQRVNDRTKELANLVSQLEKANDELKLKEIEVTKALNKEKELNELKSRFVSMASHEFRTPLSTILSSASLIEKYTDEEEIEKKQKHLNRIKVSVKNLTGILNDFLSLDKLEEGKINAKMVECNIHGLSQSVIDDLEPLQKSGQKIRYTHEGKTEAFIDENLTKNIIINLLSNAIKYSPENQEIDFKTAHQKGTLTIEVTDKGIGIPEEEQHNMFDRFFRAKNVTNIQGTGLGLNIVKKYVDLMHGNIDFHSKIEEGTTFKITIPQKQ